MHLNNYLSLASLSRKICIAHTLACRNNPQVRKEVAAAIIKAITNNEVAKAADIPTKSVVVRFSEA